jgi:hypothetical protein
LKIDRWNITFVDKAAGESSSTAATAGDASVRLAQQSESLRRDRVAASCRATPGGARRAGWRRARRYLRSNVGNRGRKIAFRPAATGGNALVGGVFRDCANAC